MTDPEILYYVRKLSPTLKELREPLGVRSTAGVRRLIWHLVDQGTLDFSLDGRAYVADGWGDTLSDNASPRKGRRATGPYFNGSVWRVYFFDGSGSRARPKSYRTFTQAKRAAEAFEAEGVGASAQEEEAA